MPTPEVAVFGDQVSKVLAHILRDDLVGVYFVGSVALGGYVPDESDVDIAAVSESALSEGQKTNVASAIVEVSGVCPARGVEFTLYRREVAGSVPQGAEFEVNANGGPRMPTAVHLDAYAEQGFWYVLDRAIAHRSGVVISGPPPRTVFGDVPRRPLLQAMFESMVWHRAHEKATLYSVLNACRAWRFADENLLGSKLEGATWARARWPDTDVIDAAVALRHGEDAALTTRRSMPFLWRSRRTYVMPRKSEPMNLLACRDERSESAAPGRSPALLEPALPERSDAVLRGQATTD